MLWPLILPMKISFVVMVAIIVATTIFAPYAKWKRTRALGTVLTLVPLLFVASCCGIMGILDMQRFGTFEYATYSEVDDFRIERYLPTSATNITLNKYAAGHQAQYTISETDLRRFLDALWDFYDGRSKFSREQLQDGKIIAPDIYADRFSELNWPPTGTMIELHSPVQADGGGATYYLHVESETAYHAAAYW